MILNGHVTLKQKAYHVLVSVGQVLGGGGVLSGGHTVLDGVLLDVGVVDGARPFPRHQQAAQVVGRRLHVLRLRAAHCLCAQTY